MAARYVMYCRIFFFLSLICLCPSQLLAQKQPVSSSADILQAIRKLKVNAAVLYIAAHPDDENTRLLTYYSREKLYRTAYLSLTHGEGGQNLIGDEQGKPLGFIRTEELKAARRIDGAEQFFAEAEDFGFSKTMEETLQKWNKDQVLERMVRVIRSFKPDIIITRFPPDKRAGHGHHAASAQLAEEAFGMAADSNKFTHHFKEGLQPWQSKALYWNTYNFGAANTTASGQITLDVGGYNPLIGKSYGEMAAESRSQHKSQGFGSAAQRGAQSEYFIWLKGDAAFANNPPLVTPDRKKAALNTKCLRQTDALIARYKADDPSASIPALIRLYKDISEQDQTSHRLAEIQQIILQAAGIYAEATTDQEYTTAHDSLTIQTLIINRSNVAAQLQSVTCMPLQKDTLLQDYILPENIAYKQSFSFITPSSASDFSVVFKVRIGGMDIPVTRPVQYKFTDPVKGEIRWPLATYPAFAIKPLQDVQLIQHDSGIVRLTFHIQKFMRHALSRQYADLMAHTAYGDTLLRTFNTDDLALSQGLITVQIPVARLSQKVHFYIRWNDQVFDHSLERIQYDHIPAITWLEKAAVICPRVPYVRAGEKIGYINGAGDRVDETLRMMGYQVDELKREDISFDKLRRYDAVITGIRAYNQHEWLAEKHDVFMQYADSGGVMLIQYNTSSMVGPLKHNRWLYPFVISRNRVTEEDAQVNILQPDHPIFQYPNQITHADFEQWTQERSVYEADALDFSCTPLISMHDKDEPDRKGSLVVMERGKGRIIYSGLTFFRQLPAGVPGAIRLFANLIAPAAQQKK